MANVIDTLKERGFIENMTHDEELRELFDSSPVTCYIGFDPTASSLHVGSLVPIMSLAHMQREGHRPIALVGGGTGLVGDPSGKTEMRKMLTIEQVEKNALGLKGQLSRFIDFSGGNALLLNNADWLVPLNYIEFLRDIGRHFSVNRMIKAESYRMRLDSEEGLSFIEFNYMVLQAYDFLALFDSHGCRLQMGGSDQWGNIVAGVDLIRRMRQGTAFGITFPLITTSTGIKMGKTHKGAVWLDAGRTSAYDYFQFWINTDDPDVERFLALFTFLPMEEIRAVGQLAGADLNAAKTVLAFEATRLAHGPAEAANALIASEKMFGTRRIPRDLLASSAIPRGEERLNDESVPTTTLSEEEIGEGMPVFKLFALTGLADSSGAARRLIQQGGAYIDGKRVGSVDDVVKSSDFKEMQISLRAGKKRFHKVCMKS
jgi:tyrosyl-tRNA synthetase